MIFQEHQNTHHWSHWRHSIQRPRVLFPVAPLERGPASFKPCTKSTEENPAELAIFHQHGPTSLGYVDMVFRYCGTLVAQFLSKNSLGCVLFKDKSTKTPTTGGHFWRLVLFKELLRRSAKTARAIAGAQGRLLAGVLAGPGHPRRVCRSSVVRRGRHVHKYIYIYVFKK